MKRNREELKGPTKFEKPERGGERKVRKERS